MDNSVKWLFGQSQSRGAGHVEDALSAYLDGALPAAERAAVEAHLAACPACRTALAELRATQALLRAAPRPAPPRSFALTPAQAEALRSGRTRPAAARPATPRLAIGLRVAAAAVFVLFATVLGSDLRGSARLATETTRSQAPAPAAAKLPHPEATAGGPAAAALAPATPSAAANAAGAASDVSATPPPLGGMAVQGLPQAVGTGTPEAAAPPALAPLAVPSGAPPEPPEVPGMPLWPWEVGLGVLAVALLAASLVVARRGP